MAERPAANSPFDRAKADKADEMATRARRLVEEMERTVQALRSQQDLSGAGEVVALLEQAGQQAQAVAGLLQEAQEQAAAEVEHGRAQGREIVEQAKALRLAVLRDMARRRQTARAQVERLRAGRDKLMATLSEARHSIDQSMETAKLSLAEAKVVADAAARRVEHEAEPSDVALLSELDDAQMVGQIPALGAPDEDSEEVGEGVRLLSPAERDPLETAADHPVLIGATDSTDVDAIFARLRSQRGEPQLNRETVPNAANTPVGSE